MWKWGGNMSRRDKYKELKDEIIKIAKKLSIITVHDIEVLLERPPLEIIPAIETLIGKGYLKKEENSYIYIKDIKPLPVPSSGNKSKNNHNKKYKDRLPLKVLPFKPQKPKEIYFRHINEMEGFKEYFFAPQKVKDYIKNIMRILRTAHNLKYKKLREFLKENNLTVSAYEKLKTDIAVSGLRTLLGRKRNAQEPAEVYYFFKQYYLSPVKLSAEDSRELAIQKLERITGMRIGREYIRIHDVMLKDLKEEYTKEEIEKFRTPNFSEFDVENMFHD